MHHSVIGGSITFRPEGGLVGLPQRLGDFLRPYGWFWGSGNGLEEGGGRGEPRLS
jgi:hypothetical protein